MRLDRVPSLPGVVLPALILAAALVAIMLRPGSPPIAEATFHDAVIHEIMFGAGGDSTVQYVEINMKSAGQNLVSGTVLTYWDNAGNADIVVFDVPADVASGANRRWIMASSSFQAASGITPDFVFNVEGAFQNSGGMVCWGAPGIFAEDPPTWNAADPNNYTDCIIYGGSYAGPTPVVFNETVTSLTAGDGTMSLTRTNNLQPGMVSLQCPTPQNNANSIGSFGPCPPAATATPTPTFTPTPTPSSTPTPTATPTPCGADADGDLICDPNDNCVNVPNAGQQNSDTMIGNGKGLTGQDASVPNAVADTEGDACESDGDADNDGIIDSAPDPDSGGDVTYDDDNDGGPAMACLGGADGDDDGPSWDIDCNGILDGILPATCAALSGSTDADTDRVPERHEVCKWGTSDADTDSDGDSLTDCLEIIDVDGDGMKTFLQDLLPYAKGVQLTGAAFGKDGDFDYDGSNSLMFLSDLIPVAKLIQLPVASGGCNTTPTAPNP